MLSAIHDSPELVVRDKLQDQGVRVTCHDFSSGIYADALQEMPVTLKSFRSHIAEVYGEDSEYTKVCDKWITNFSAMTSRPDFFDFYQQVYEANKYEIVAYAEATWQYFDTGVSAFSGEYAGHDLKIFLDANQQHN